MQKLQAARRHATFFRLVVFIIIVNIIAGFAIVNYLVISLINQTDGLSMSHIILKSRLLNLDLVK